MRASDLVFFYGSVNTVKKVDPVKLRHKQLSTAYFTLDSVFYSLMSKKAPS